MPACAAGRDEGEVKRGLDDLLARSRLAGLGRVYALPEIPLLVNIHQFRLKTEPEDIEAARLYQQFFIRDGFYKYYESSEKGTPLTRVIPVEAAVEHRQKILDSEEAPRIIIDEVDFLALTRQEALVSFSFEQVKDLGENHLEELGWANDPERITAPSPRSSKVLLVAGDQEIHIGLQRRGKNGDVFRRDVPFQRFDFLRRGKRSDFEIEEGKVLTISGKDLRHLLLEVPFDFHDVEFPGHAGEHGQVEAEQIKDDARRAPIRKESGQDHVRVKEDPNLSFFHRIPW